MTALQQGYDKDWTRLRRWFWRLGPLRITRSPSWEPYVKGPSFWRSGRTLCGRYGTIVINVF